MEIQKIKDEILKLKKEKILLLIIDLCEDLKKKNKIIKIIKDLTNE